MSRRLLTIALTLLAVAALPLSGDAGLTPRCVRVLADADHAAFGDDGRLLVWVYFADKDLGGAALADALARAGEDLHPRVRARRARAAGAPLVDAHDLPVAETYLARARATGARLRHTSRWLNAASFAATPAQVRLLAAADEVLRVDLVARGRRPAPPLPVETSFAPVPLKSAGGIDYGGSLAALTQINVPAVHELGLSGRDVVVGMLDTGFRTTLAGVRAVDVLDVWDFVGDDDTVDMEEGDPSTSHHHGTMTLSTLAGWYPGELVGPAYGASVLLARTEDVGDETPVEEDHWVAGLEWAEANGADIVTSSLVYTSFYLHEEMDGDTAVTTVAADLAAGRGLVVVNSAGNDRNGYGMVGSPADGDSVIAVGAVDDLGDVAYFSSPGPTADGRIKPDLAALGVDVVVAHPLFDRTFGEVNGTSFSGPLVAGVAALMLERSPELLPMEVREALRSTASQAGAPDNDLGWGIVDALAAVTWYGPVFTHTPLADTEDSGGPYTATAGITARAGLDDPTARLHYRVDGGSWTEVALMPTGGGPVSWFGEIPGQTAGARVDYYLAGADLDGYVVTEPVRAPARLHSFVVGTDTRRPTVSHVPVGNQTMVVWPPLVTCTATDNLGMAGVDLRYRLNGGAEQGPFPLVSAGGDAWELVMPLAAAAVAAGDVVAYTLTAQDAAAAPNETVVGPHAIAILAVAEFDTVVTDGAAHAIPDDDPAGVPGFVGVLPALGEYLLDVSVDMDLTHPDVGQLKITLQGPDDTTLVLHDHGNPGTADLTGNWPQTLSVAGPGDLDVFRGARGDGLWVLTVVDDVAGDTGTVNSWSLRLTFAAEVTRVGDTPSRPVTSLASAVPNPFNPVTEISFVNARAGRSRLAVFDLRGMLVRVLHDGYLPVGPGRVTWNGRDGAGRNVGSGVYLYRLVTPDGSHERKMTLVR